MFKLINTVLNAAIYLVFLGAMFGAVIILFYRMYTDIKDATYTEKFFLDSPWICKKYLASVDKNPAKKRNQTTLENARRAAIKMNWVNYVEGRVK